jgi:hypothetical protein
LELRAGLERERAWNLERAWSLERLQLDLRRTQVRKEDFFFVLQEKKKKKKATAASSELRIGPELAELQRAPDRSGACCTASKLRAPESSRACVATRAPELRKLRSLLAAVMQQASELLQKLRSLLAIATQQAPEDLQLWSLLACCCNATSSGACLLTPEYVIV